jgi:hypothetical protein
MQSKQLTLFFLFLFLFLLTVSSAGSVMASLMCPTSRLAEWACDCVGGLDNPRLPCCMMVVSSVGIGFGGKGKVPCLCLVAREPAFLATGLDVHKILEMYHVCYGALPVDPHTGDFCQG